MIDHVTSLVERDFQSPQEMSSFQDGAPGGLRTEPHEDILTQWTVLSRDIRSSLLSMLATLKLLNRGYYGKMDKPVARKINELLSDATRLSGVAEECLERMIAAWEDLGVGVQGK
jgi:hypothetical protein